MSNLKMRARWLIRLLLSVGLFSQLSARTRPAETLRARARAEEVAGHFDEALALASRAVALDPSDPAYALELHRIRFEDGAMHIKEGARLRDAGDPVRALAEFHRANEADPSSDFALQQIRSFSNAAQKAPAEPVPGRLDDALAPLPKLRPLSREPLDVKMTNKPRLLFETVCKIAGVNIIFDPDYDSQQAIRSQQIDVSHTTLEQVLDQLSTATRSFWKPLSPNTIFVTIDNPAKRRDYAEQVVRIFYLSNTTGPQEMQELLTVLRTVIDIQKVFSYSSQNAVVVRAEADSMLLVEKIIAGLDRARAEVVIDVMVMEVSSTWTRALSTAFAGGGINTSVTSTPRSGISTPATSSTSSSSSSSSSTSGTSSTSVTLNNLGRLSTADYSITNLPGATLQAVLSDSGTRLLQQPQLRAVENTKAVLKIGDKVPYASGSYSAGTSTTTVSALVNTQFTYLDVGVNLEITPRIHNRDEVSLHMDLDVSQVKAEINLGGINEPEISQNKISADVRLREGEVSLIGGIIQQTDSKAVTGIPGLATVPILGRLFSGENLGKDRTELLIALVPHIVRAPDGAEWKETASGSAAQIKVSVIPEGEGVRQAPKVQSANPDPPATAPPAADAPGTSQLRFVPSRIDTQLGSLTTVTVYGPHRPESASITAQLRFDPHLLQVVTIVPAPETPNIHNQTGSADIEVRFDPATAPADGLFSFVIQAVGRGDTALALEQGMPGLEPVAPLSVQIR